MIYLRERLWNRLAYRGLQLTEAQWDEVRVRVVEEVGLGAWLWPQWSPGPRGGLRTRTRTTSVGLVWVPHFGQVILVPRRDNNWEAFPVSGFLVEDRMKPSIREAVFDVVRVARLGGHPMHRGVGPIPSDMVAPSELRKLRESAEAIRRGVAGCLGEQSVYPSVLASRLATAWSHGYVGAVDWGEDLTVVLVGDAHGANFWGRPVRIYPHSDGNYVFGLVPHEDGWVAFRPHSDTAIMLDETPELAIEGLLLVEMCAEDRPEGALSIVKGDDGGELSVASSAELSLTAEIECDELTPSHTKWDGVIGTWAASTAVASVSVLAAFLGAPAAPAVLPVVLTFLLGPDALRRIGRDSAEVRREAC